MRSHPQVVLTNQQKSKARDLCARAQYSGPGCAARRLCCWPAKASQDLKTAHLLSIVPRTAARLALAFLHDGIAGWSTTLRDLAARLHSRNSCVW